MTPNLKTRLVFALLVGGLVAACNVISYEKRVAYLNTLNGIAHRADSMHTYYSDSLSDGNAAWRQRAVNTILDTLHAMQTQLENIDLEVPAADTLREATKQYINMYAVGWTKEFEQVVKLYNEETISPARQAEINQTVQQLYNDFDARKRTLREAFNGASLAYRIANHIEM
jgi:hypothetical protein